MSTRFPQLDTLNGRPNLAVGQFWRDRDPRMKGRVIVLRIVGPTYVWAENVVDRGGQKPRRVRLRADTLRTRFVFDGKPERW